MNPLTINFNKPSLDLVEHLVAVFPGVPQAYADRETVLRMQGQRQVIEYIAHLAAPPGQQVQIKETLIRVPRPTQDAQAGGGPASARSAGYQDPADSRPADPPPATWGDD